MSSLPEALSGDEVSSSLPTTRVDRLLRERIRRNRSHQAFDTCEDVPQEDPILETVPEPPTQARLVVVANRLPVTCSKDTYGRWQLQASAGGLVSALKGVSNYVTLWIGWPGIWVKPGREREELTGMLKAEGFSPVWLDQTLLDLYYNGFCNSVLWQLFHYVPLNIDTWQKMAEHRAMQMQWQAYQVANEKFADVVLAEYVPTDVVWVQDYHLMLLPSLLKQNAAKMKVGFFLHTPFPSSEMYRTLPVREEVLRAVLAADLVGFHTYDYARHFISSCTRILGLEGTPEGVENNGVLTRVGTFPIGIDPERFTRALESEEVQSQTAKLLNRYAGRKIMLGVDRLDMVKGIPQKLLAYEKFLEENPEWRDKVLLVQIAVPSRTDVPEYQKLRSMVHEIVGRINGQYGTLTYVPIYHLDTSLSFTELCALYAVTDVAMVTSLRDGMNLVSYEYVACQSDNAGVLVLSEFAGAAQSLGAGALLVNPWNISDMAQAIYDALSMSEDERRERHRQNYMHVQTHTAQHWADTFITELNDTHIEADLRMRHTPPPLDVQEVVRAYRNSKRRLIVLGYNATLTTSVEAPRLPKRQFEQVKALAKVNPRVMRSVCELCTDPANVVVIFSGSETSKLEEIFGPLPVWLAAENGVYVRPPAVQPAGAPAGGQSGAGGSAQGGGAQAQSAPAAPQQPQWKCVFDQVHCEWMESVQLVFDYFCERTPRSFVEARETSLVWNYKYADVEFGRIQARDLLQHLWTGPISNAPVEIIQGGKSVEVRPVGVTKGLAMQRLVGLIASEGGHEAAAFDMVLCIGHLLGRDENLFSLFEGARIDGAAPAHNSRSERVAAAVAAAAAAANGGGGGAGTAAAAAAGASGASTGQTPADMLSAAAAALERSSRGRSAATDAGSAASAAMAAATAAHLQAHGLHHHHFHHHHHAHHHHAAHHHGRSSSTGGIIGNVVPEDGNVAQLQAASAHGSAGGALQAQPGLSTTAGPSSRAPSGIAQALAAAQPGQHPSPFVTQSNTPLPTSNSPRDAAPVPIAGAAAQSQYQDPNHGPKQGQAPVPGLGQGPQQSQPHAAGAGPGPGAGSPGGSGRAPPWLPHHVAQQMPQQYAGPLPRSGGGGGDGCSGGAAAAAGAYGGGGGGGEAGGSSGLPAAGGSSPGPTGRHRAPLQTHSMDRFDLGRRIANAMMAERANASAADRLAGIFPPKYLYTCTVGRNRSKARYALATSAEVGDVLEAVVQQGIYRRPPAPACSSAYSAPPDVGLGATPSLSCGRLESMSSADALSPDSMFNTLQIVMQQQHMMQQMQQQQQQQQQAGHFGGPAGGGAGGSGGGGGGGMKGMYRDYSSASLVLEDSTSLPHSPAAAAFYPPAGATATGASSAAAAANANANAPPHLASLGRSGAPPQGPPYPYPFASFAPLSQSSSEPYPNPSTSQTPGLGLHQGMAQRRTGVVPQYVGAAATYSHAPAPLPLPPSPRSSMSPSQHPPAVGMELGLGVGLPPPVAIRHTDFVPPALMHAPMDFRARQGPAAEVRDARHKQSEVAAAAAAPPPPPLSEHGAHGPAATAAAAGERQKD